MAKHREIEQAVARESTLEHLASKADLQAMQATLIKWIVGTGISVFIAMIAARQLSSYMP